MHYLDAMGAAKVANFYGFLIGKIATVKGVTSSKPRNEELSGRTDMKIEITPQAEQLLAKKGGTMTVDFISAVG